MINNRVQRRATRRYSPVFFLPTVLAFVIGFAWPFVWGVYLSFFRFKTLGNTSFTGIQNYKNALSDNAFWTSFGFTSAFAVVSVLVINVLAFLVALALTRKIRGAKLFRTVFFLPNLIGGIVLGYIWKVILNGITVKFFGMTLALNSTYGFWGLVILTAWQQIGYMMII